LPDAEAAQRRGVFLASRIGVSAAARGRNATAPVRRGRPPNLERRRTIAAEATRVFADRGYYGATMREVAEACGMGETLLYRYFARKELLRDAVAEHALAQLDAATDAVTGATGRGLDAAGFLATAARVVLRHIDAESAWFAAWLGGLPLTDEQRQGLHAAYERLFQRIAGYPPLRRDCRDSYATARTMCGAIRTMVLWQNRLAFEPASVELRELYLEELVKTVLYGSIDRTIMDRRPRVARR
jgi:AcrR family transcriptional regulator